ncbi:MAG: ribosome maturation factor RimM [Anaerolineae bacterium]|nr:ribosome maturation factor RimM [Anaerolineae bacterium]
MQRRPEPDFLAIGRITRPHGVHGEMRVDILSDFPDRWNELTSVYIGAQYHQYEIIGFRAHQKVILLKLVGCTSRDEVEALRGELIYVTIDQAMPLEEDEFYHYQVIGLEARTESGEILGEIVDVLRPPKANEIFVVHGVRGEILIPVIAEAVRGIDLEAGIVTVYPMPGLLPGS